MGTEAGASGPDGGQAVRPLLSPAESELLTRLHRIVDALPLWTIPADERHGRLRAVLPSDVHAAIRRLEEGS